MKTTNSTYLVGKYAQAFVRVFNESLSLENIHAMQEAADFFARRKKTLFFLRLPVISNVVKREALHYVCTQYNVPSSVDMLIDLLIMDKRSELMPLVLDKICGLYYQIHNIELFTIASSDSLSESQVKDIEQFLAQCTGHVILSHRIIDTDLIAGIRLQSATSLWEHSIRRQLAHVQQLFMR